MKNAIALLFLATACAACSKEPAAPAAPAATASTEPASVVDAQPAAPQATTHPGKLVYDKWCGICHGRGERMPGTASLQAKYSGAIPAALEDRSDMNAEFITFYVRNGVMIMPAFRKTEVTDADLATLIDYLSQKKAP